MATERAEMEAQMVAIEARMCKATRKGKEPMEEEEDEEKDLYNDAKIDND